MITLKTKIFNFKPNAMAIDLSWFLYFKWDNEINEIEINIHVAWILTINIISTYLPKIWGIENSETSHKNWVIIDA